MKQTEFATHLGWNLKNVAPRLRALSLLDVCTRCGGGGHHSYCQQWGTTCFKCSGSGKQLPKFTKKLLLTVSNAVEAGGLNAYFAKCAQIAAARKALPGLMAAAHDVYSVIGNAYDAAYKTRTITEELHSFQSRANALYWGNGRGLSAGPRPVMLGVHDVETMAGRGEVPCDWAAERIQGLTESLRALVADFLGAAAQAAA